jgi:tetratricopeptide (TPR) repeat protein
VKLDSDYPEAVFELGNLKLDQQKFEEAASLFRHYVEVSSKSAQGYYKLAMAEHRLRDNADADREMNIFRTLSKSPPPAPYPLQHLFDYLGKRNALTAEQRDVSDIRTLEAEVQQHPDRPRSLYLLAEALLTEGRTSDALQVLQRLDALSGGDYRTELNTGILLGRFHQNEHAMRYFQAALKANPTSDDARYDLAETYIQAGNDGAALEQLLQISSDGQKQASDLGLAGEVYAHLGQYDEAVRSLNQAIAAAADEDQYYVSLALLRLRAGTPGEAEKIVRLGLSRIPDSAALYWTSGLVAIASGRQQEAETVLKKASRLNASSQTYLATLGMLYYQEGRYSDARDVLKQCMEMFPGGVMDFEKINAVLVASSDSPPQTPAVLSAGARTQLWQFAIAMHDQEQ